MKKLTLLTVLLAAVTALLMTATAVAEPAVVVHLDEEQCLLAWLDANGNFITVPADGGTLVFTNSKNGNIALSCHGSIDLDDPDIATLDMVCALFPEACQGNGAARFDFDSTMGGYCFAGGNITADWQAIVTPSGQTSVNCHFKPNS